jgi:hypothetical protein
MLAAKKRYYYDITISNNSYTNPAGKLYKAKFSETRDSPLFDDAPSKYCLSVVRFTVPSSLIPYQYVSTIFDVAAPANPNKMTYSISMSFAGTVYREYLQWVPQAAVPVPQPPPPFGPDLRFKDELFNAYYALYSLTHFCEIINRAFENCFNVNILPLLPAPAPGTTYKAPYITFDGATELFTLWVSNLFVGISPAIVLGCNYLFNSNFNTSWNTVALAVGAPDGLDVKWIFLANDQNTIVDPTAAGGFTYKFQQEFDTTGSISKFQSLLFVSPTLPCNTDIVSNTSVPQGIGNNFGSVAGGFIPLITDFEIDQSTVRNKQGFIHYVPSAEYRRLTMRGNQPISQVDIDIFWKDIFGNIYSLYIEVNSAATIKIMFEEQ